LNSQPSYRPLKTARPHILLAGFLDAFFSEEEEPSNIEIMNILLNSA